MEEEELCIFTEARALVAENYLQAM